MSYGAGQITRSVKAEGRGGQNEMKSDEPLGKFPPLKGRGIVFDNQEQYRRAHFVRPAAPSSIAGFAPLRRTLYISWALIGAASSTGRPLFHALR